MKIVLRAINIILTTISMISILFSSFFWMGTKDQRDELKENVLSFLLNRLLFDLIIISILLALTMFINWIYLLIDSSNINRNSYLRILFLKRLGLYIGFAIICVTIGYYL